MRTAVVTGAGGQDGRYLCRLLSQKGYRVTGLVRPGKRAPDSLPNVHYVAGDITHHSTWDALIGLRPDEFYHLAALQNIPESFGAPSLYLRTNTLATLDLLTHLFNVSPKTRLFYPSSCEVIVPNLTPVPEDTSWLMGGNSPYAISKLASQLLCETLREQNGLWITCGILYNHESPLRPAHFLSQQIARGFLNFKKTGERLEISNFSLIRDWHHAQDTVLGMWLSLQHEVPLTFTFASGIGREVRDWLIQAAQVFNVDVEEAVIYYPFRKDNISRRVGNPTKANRLLGWSCTIPFNTMVREICEEVQNAGVC